MTGITENSGGRHGNRMRIAVWGAAAFLLLLPLAAMQFTNEVDWTPSDFMVIGAMLFFACGTYELAVRMRGDIAYRTAFGIAVVAAFLLVWINLSVGIIGAENNPANLMFGGVLAVGFVGALIARLRPQGMSYALIATAIAQLMIGMIALAMGLGFEAAALGIVFGTIWVASAVLFRIAARWRTDPPDITTQKLEVQSTLSAFIAVAGAVVMTTMVIVESEPGLIPLLLVACGVTGHFVTRAQIRRHRNQAPNTLK
jgi:hypothetical protein